MDAQHPTAWMRFNRSARNAGGPSAFQNAGYVLGMALFLLAGCRSGMNLDLLEQELRLYEDRIYELEFQLEDCQRQNTVLQEQLDDQQSRPGKSWPPKSERGDSYRPLESKVLEPDIDLSEPKIEEENGVSGPAAPVLEDPDKLPENPLPPTPEEDGEARSVSSRPEELPIPGTGQPVDQDHALIDLGKPLTDVGQVDRIVLHRLLGRAQPPAPEGIVLQAVVEPRDGNGHPIRIDGEISLMILDPSRSASESKIARWTYSASDDDVDWRHSGLGSGMHVTLPIDPAWADATYELWARLITPDQQKYLTRVEFDLNRAAMALKSDRTPDSGSSNPAVARNLDQEVSVLVRPSHRTQAGTEKVQKPKPPTPARRRWFGAQRSTESRSTGQLTEAPPWSPPSPTSDLEAAEPIRQAVRPQWSPYR